MDFTGGFMFCLTFLYYKSIQTLCCGSLDFGQVHPVCFYFSSFECRA